ncbi:MAG: hypothetical protein FWE94_01655 [Coriobacteriia bacterium]|nr:hypothetical protein [Coriobacteriia bacterium]
MGKSELVSLLLGDAVGRATAMTWVPLEAAHALAGGPSAESGPETLALVAQAFDVDLAFVPASEPWGTDAVKALKSAGIAAGWIVEGVVSRVALERGWFPTIAESARSPQNLAVALRDAMRSCLFDVRRGHLAEADVLLCGDDLAGSAGWLLAPDFVLETLMPCYCAIAKVWGKGRPAVFHSDGDIRVVYSALAAAGFSAVHIAGGQRVSLRKAFTAACSAGLVPMGGVEIRNLAVSDVQQAGYQAESLADLTDFESAVIADDGAITTAEELALFGSAIESVRRGSL